MDDDMNMDREEIGVWEREWEGKGEGMFHSYAKIMTLIGYRR